MNNYKITTTGYRISNDHERTNEFKKDLFICPFTENPQTYPIFRYSKNYLYLPKFYGLDKLGPPSEYIEQEGENINITFNGELRDYQIEPGNKILNEISKNGSTLACLYTGWGKTFLALWVIYKLKKKTLIIVHTENLLEQWKNEIKKILDEDVGIIKGPVIDIENKNIVIGMLQSISMKTYDNTVFKSFGFTIYDECHHLPGRCFSRVLYKIGSKYNLGLSATLTRPDGLTKVIKYFLGKVIVHIKLNILQPKIEFLYTDIEPIKEKLMINGRINTQSMITDLCNDFSRNIQITSNIIKKYNEGRKILILTERKTHCYQLLKLLSSSIQSDNMGLYIGGMKNEALHESNLKQIIIATYKMASEGYNNPELNTLILASPIVRVEQAIGRILRKENSFFPLVVDVVDNFSFLIHYFNKRNKYYISKKYLNTKEYNEEHNEEKITLNKYAFIDIE